LKTPIERKIPVDKTLARQQDVELSMPTMKDREEMVNNKSLGIEMLPTTLDLENETYRKRRNSV
jgi:hypothetical protein